MDRLERCVFLCRIPELLSEYWLAQRTAANFVPHQAWTSPTLTFESLISNPCWWFVLCSHLYQCNKKGSALLVLYFIFSQQVCNVWRPSLCLDYRDAETEATTEPRVLSSSNVSFNTTGPPSRLPSAPVSAVPPTPSTLLDPGHQRGVSPQKPPPVSGNLGQLLLCVAVSVSVCSFYMSKSSIFTCLCCRSANLLSEICFKILYNISTSCQNANMAQFCKASPCTDSHTALSVYWEACK